MRTITITLLCLLAVGHAPSWWNPRTGILDFRAVPQPVELMRSCSLQSERDICSSRCAGRGGTKSCSVSTDPRTGRLTVYCDCQYAPVNLNLYVKNATNKEKQS